MADMAEAHTELDALERKGSNLPALGLPQALIEIQCDLGAPTGITQNWKTIWLPAVPGSTELIMIGDHSYLCQGRRFLVDANGRTNAKVCILVTPMSGAGPVAGSLVRAPASALNGLRRSPRKN